MQSSKTNLVLSEDEGRHCQLLIFPALTLLSGRWGSVSSTVQIVAGDIKLPIGEIRDRSQWLAEDYFCELNTDSLTGPLRR